MKTVRFLVLLSAGMLLLPGSVFTAAPPVHLFMPDGQLVSHPIRVYVTPDIPESLDPRLGLAGSHEITQKLPGEDRLIKPAVLANRQSWQETVLGRKITQTGTLLLFDLGNYPIHPFKAAARLTPTLYWKAAPQDRDRTRKAVGAREVYVGKSTGVIGYTLALEAVLLVFILAISRAAKGNAVFLICGSDGRLSLSRLQMALWTLAIGGVLFGYGLFHIEVPEIPDSLVALMGLSLATTGISYARVSKLTAVPASPPGAAAPTPAAPPSAPVGARLGDLVADSSGELSIAKAQMIFWTGLMLVLFITKNVMEGALWEVPWQMVALMGMSQAGYLGPKFVK